MQARSARLRLDAFSYMNQQFTDTKKAAQLSHLTCYTVLHQSISPSGKPVQLCDLRSCYFLVLACWTSGLNQLIKELNKQQS